LISSNANGFFFEVDNGDGNPYSIASQAGIKMLLLTILKSVLVVVKVSSLSAVSISPLLSE
jgi:hypothetical protein